MAAIVSAAPINPVNPVTAPVNTQPQYKSEEYTVAGVVLKFFDEKVKDIAKALSYTTFWLGEAIPNLPPEAKAFGSRMGEFKNFISATEVPKKVMEVWESSKKFMVNSTIAAGRDLFNKVAFLTNSVVDSIDLSSRFLPIGQAAMTWFKGINFAATLGSSTNGAVEQVENLVKPDNNAHKRNYYLIKLASNLSYGAVGVIGLGGIVTGVAVAPWMIVAGLTSGLACTIGSYFYERLYDPTEEGKNLIITRKKPAAAAA
jgi:hypothetical protein